MTTGDVYAHRLDRLGEEFRFGVATAATCIEGRPSGDTGLSIWDVFAAAPGRVTDHSHPNEGPAHITHSEQDLVLLSDLGINSYRASLPWSVINDTPEALGFYDELLDRLCASQITPVMTLSHYDMPLSVMEAGGWLVRDTAERFAEYAAGVAQRLGDRVFAWVTMNSPFVHAGLGYGLGVEAPGLTLLGGALHAAQNQLVGHGLAVQALRATGSPRVGIANAHTSVTALDADADDVAAAEIYGALHNHALADPIFGRAWGAELRDFPGAPADELSETDRALVAAPLDFYGVNYYHPQRVEAAPDNKTIPFAFAEPGPDDPTDAFGWPIDPSGLTATLIALRDRYPSIPTIWVTENGTQDAGGLDDDHRSRFLRDHLDAIADAVEAGVDVSGYFHWSLLDGWEFAEGFTRRMGLVAVDPVTFERHPKASYHAYRNLLAGRRRTGA